MSAAFLGGRSRLGAQLGSAIVGLFTRLLDLGLDLGLALRSRSADAAPRLLNLLGELVEGVGRNGHGGPPLCVRHSDYALASLTNMCESVLRRSPFVVRLGVVGRR